MKKNTKEIDDYQINLDEKLGKGSFGQVYKGIKKSTNTPVAVKMISKLKWNNLKAQLKLFLKEVQIMDNLNHQNVIRYYDSFQSLNNCYIVEELCDCDLSSFLQNHFKANKQFLPQKEAINILKQICSGCLYLAHKGIIHRDLKPQNILYSKGKFKIGDFGLSKKNVAKNAINQTFAGTPCYMAPQVMQNKKYTSKCDIWSIGVIYYFILHGKLPWNGKNLEDIIANTNRNTLIINENKFSEETVDFLRKALQIKEVDRFNWKELYSHPLFGEYFKDYKDLHQKLDYKCQTIVRNLRLKMQIENKSIHELVFQINNNNRKGLNYEKFAILLKKIDADLTNQEINHVFESFDLDGNGFISIQELENAANKVNQKKIEPKYINKKQFSEFLIQKVFRTLVIIKRKCQRQNLSLYDQFIKLRTNKKMQKTQFKIFITNFDPKLKDQQLQQMFVYFDKTNQNGIYVNIFMEIFERCTNSI